MKLARLLVPLLLTLIMVKSAVAISIVPQGQLYFDGYSSSTYTSSTGGSISGIAQSAGIWEYQDHYDLPTNLSDLDYFYLEVGASYGPIQYSLTINGVDVVLGKPTSTNDTYNKTDLALAGVNMSDTYLDIYITANNTFYVKLTFYDNFYNIYRNINYTIDEVTLNTPEVTVGKPGIYAVKTVAVFKNNNNLSVKNFTINIDYPPSAANQPVKSLVVDQWFDPGETKTVVIKYQKKTPYILNVSEKDLNKTKKVEMQVYSYEDLKAELRIDDSILPDLKNVSDKNVSLIVNGQKVDFRLENTTIKAYVPLKQGKNSVEVVYTSPVISTFAPVEHVEKETTGNFIQQIVEAILDFFKSLFGLGG